LVGRGKEENSEICKMAQILREKNGEICRVAPIFKFLCPHLEEEGVKEKV
jgi:hypothetical protein